MTDSETRTVLTVGTHLAASDGACLMEVVSRVAGHPWSDAPSCTHPLLGLLARMVNDASSQASRQQLLGHVPSLALASSDDAAVAARLALVCAEHALRRHPTPWLAHLRAVCARQLRREMLAAATAPTGAGAVLHAARRALFLHGAAPRTVEASVFALCRLPTDERDTALRGLLEAGLDVVARRPDDQDDAHAAQRKPMLPVELSGVLAVRAETRYRLQYERWHR